MKNIEDIMEAAEEKELEEEREELWEKLEKYEPNLKVLQDVELSELIHWMNENNMWEERKLSYETVIDAYKIVMFIKNCNLPHEYHI
jgi:hypothetical protein